MEFNIEREERLIEALGLHLIGPNSAKRFLILDEKENEVGFIQYIDLNSNNKEKMLLEKFGYLKKYSYFIKIDSKKVYYEAVRKVNSFEKQDNDYSYELNIKRENGTTDCLEITLGDNASLTLDSKIYGNMSFKINSNKLFLNFMSSTENFNIEETIMYKVVEEKTSKDRKEYTYQIRYCPKNLELDDKERVVKTCEISGESFSSSLNKVDIVDRCWDNGHIWLDRKNTTFGTIEELVYKHKTGINTFNHFRYLLNQILPFKVEIISLMCEQNLEQVEEIPFLKVKLKKDKNIA